MLSLEQISDAFHARVGIGVLNDKTITIELSQPVPYFLDQLALAVCSPVYKPSVEGWILDEHEKNRIIQDGWYTTKPPPMSQRVWVSVDEDSGRIQQQYYWARPGTLVCNGPFILEDWRYKRDMWLARNPYYHSPEITTIDTMQGITISDANTSVLAFEGGQIDWLSSVNVEYQSDMLKQKSIGERTNIHAFPTFGTDFYSFNCCPTLSNGLRNPFSIAGVRRAFVLATNRETIVAHATRLHEPTVNSFVPPNSIVGYGEVFGLEFDPVRAADELAMAGWKDRDGDGLVEDSNGNPFPIIDLLYTTNTPRYKWISLELRDQWRRHLGVSVELRGTDNKFLWLLEAGGMATMAIRLRSLMCLDRTTGITIEDM